MSESVQLELDFSDILIHCPVCKKDYPDSTPFYFTWLPTLNRHYPICVPCRERVVAIEKEKSKAIFKEKNG